MASIKCRNGERSGEFHRHESVEESRACYANGLRPPALPWSDEAPAPKRTVEHVRSNKYAGTCALCGEPVGEREGRLVPNDGNGNGYRVLHLAGQCPKAPATWASTLVPPAKREPAPAKRDYSAVTGGYYATISATGNNDFDFWYVKEGRKPGYRFVKRYIGGSGPIRISGGEAIRALETILAEGVEKCGIRFADEHCRCWKCGLPLTDELSRSRRQGPICWAK
jgi:hypothetical protein